MRILKTKRNMSTLSAGLSLAFLTLFTPSMAYSAGDAVYSVLYLYDTEGALEIKDAESFVPENYYTFIGNSLIDDDEAKGAAIYVEIGESESIDDTINASFVSNYTNANYSAGGALIVASGTLGDLNANFSNNYAVSDTGMAVGGAIANFDTISSIEGSITSNYVKTTTGVAYGGAVYAAEGSSTLFCASKDTSYSYTSNYVEVDGERLDSNGGFLYLDADASVTFSTSNAGSITIGLEDNAGFDSIASLDSSASIKKTGLGELVVNSSMEYYTGSLSVTDGTMTVNNVLSASSISVENSASLTVDTLNVYLNSDSDLGSTIVSVSEDASFSLDLLVIYLDESFLSDLTGAGISIIDDESIDIDSVVVYYGNETSRTTDIVDSSLYTFAGGVFTYVGTAVPEPSTYAMIFGVIALAFASYRRRQK